MFKLIFNILHKIPVKQAPIILGRWKLKYEEQQINKCVLWANEDNCGCCEIDLPKIDENMGDDYYLPYFL